MKRILIVLATIFVINLSSEEGHTTKLNGIDIWWDSHGDQNDPTILLIMGLNSNSKVWSQQYINGLVANDLHVIVFDNRDIGKSTWVTKEPGLITFIKYLPNFLIESFVDFIFGFIFDSEGRFNMDNPAPAKYNLSDMAMDGISILDHLGVSEAHIVGASMGGMIAQIIASKYPDKTTSLVSLMSSSRIPKTSEISDGNQENLRNMENIDEEGARGYGFYPRAMPRQLTAIFKAGDRSDIVKNITVPTLVLHGENDALLPVSYGRLTAELIPDSTFKVYKNMGHNLPKEVIPVLIEDIVNFYKKIDEIL